MAFNFLGFIYTKVFINIVIENFTAMVYIEVCSARDKLIDSVEKSFDISQDKERMYNFIKLYKKESPFHYISILDQSLSQGASQTCKANNIDHHFRDAKIKVMCYSKDLSFFTLEKNIDFIRNEYREIGMDFIFSPFLIMREFFKDKIELKIAMFVLVENSYISLAIFENSKLLYARFMNAGYLNDESEMLYSGQLLEDESEDLSLDMGEIDLNEVSFAEEFTNIENLDESDDIDEFSEEEHEDKTVAASGQKTVLSGFGEDYQRFKSIQESLNNFYKDEKYDSKFVENIYIADAVGLNNELRGYLEDEMFLSVFVRKIELPKEVCKIARMEVR